MTTDKIKLFVAAGQADGFGLHKATAAGAELRQFGCSPWEFPHLQMFGFCTDCSLNSTLAGV